MILTKAFYNRPTLEVAHDLLGKFLVSGKDGAKLTGMITEVEAYDGPQDKASHASRGMTVRNAVMFGPAGVWYVYFVYGMHEMLNIVVGAEGYPAAVLIRGIAEASGPGRVTKFFGITRKFNGMTATKKTGLWVEDRGVVFSAKQIKKSPRTGVDYAGQIWSKKHYRFHVNML